MKQGKILLTTILATVLALSFLSPVSQTLALVFDRTLSLVNTFVPAQASDGVTLVIPIEKTLLSATGQCLNPEGFTFLLTAEGSGQTLYAVSDADGHASFCLSYQPQDAEKVFRYLLTEQNDHQPGIVYSNVRYELEVSVFMQDQLLTAQLSEADREPGQFVAVFENRCVAAKAPPATGDGFPLQRCMLLLAGNIILLYILLFRKDRHRKTA